MILDEMSVFARGLDTSKNGGVNATDAFDWGTSGNSNGKGDSTDFDPKHKTAGTHGDDVFNTLFWYVFAETVVKGGLKIEWETSDVDTFAQKDVLDTVYVEETSVPQGKYIVNGRPVPKGLKRYNRVVVTSTAANKSGKVMAFVADVHGA